MLMIVFATGAFGFLFSFLLLKAGVSAMWFRYPLAVGYIGVAACLYVVWTGPGLLAEVLVDGVLMSRIYRRMRIAGQTYWMTGALRRTWIPACLIALFLAIAGFAMQKIDPDAKSIGPVIEHVSGRALIPKND
jgi:hypothetical protein